MNWFTYTLKKSPLFRVVLFLSLAILAVFVLRFSFGFLRKKPVVDSIFPVVVLPDDTVTVLGKNFGTADSGKGLRFGDDFFSSTLCTSWTDEKITFKVPKNFDTGLVSVVNANLSSQRFVLTNKEELPVVQQKTTTVLKPEITAVSKSSGSVGEKITLSGNNFGATRQNSQVIFTELAENFLQENANDIEGAFCTESNFDFVKWSDKEITICVPDTAPSGNIVVKTESGFSNPVPFGVSNRVGKKSVSNKRTILLSLSASVQDFKIRLSQNTLFLSMPHPATASMQKNVTVQTTEPPAFAVNFQGSTIYRFENLTEESKITVSESIVVDTYDVDVAVNPAQVSAVSKIKPEVLRYVEPQNDIPSDATEVAELAQKITSGSKNPYNNAKKVFTYIVENVKPEHHPINVKTDILQCIKTNRADAYEVSLMYCTLMRALGIPCIQVSGIIIGAQQLTQAHWWNEFYIDGVGWVPLDAALALNMPFETDKAASEFFAKQDGLHVAFSYDVLTQTQMLSESMVVNKTETYASRRIWEESTGLAAYNSLWLVPKVTAIY